jgi:hypothetical protein
MSILAAAFRPLVVRLIVMAEKRQATAFVAVRSIWARLRRRTSAEWVNARKSFALVGLRRSIGPRTVVGVRARSSRQPVAGVPIVLCVWRRPERLATTLASLGAQRDERLKLWIWNNNPALRVFVDGAVAGSDLQVDVVHSTRNVGGFGRFYVARRLAEEHPYVVFLDDDQVPATDFVKTLVQEFAPRTIHGAWAFRFLGTQRYWDRVPAASGERVKFCGNGGMICDTRIFLEPGLYKCPRRFWFVEDLWLSYYADHVMDWQLFKSAAVIEKEPDDQGQFQNLGATKDLMFRYLGRQGWDPLSPEPGPRPIPPGR